MRIIKQRKETIPSANYVIEEELCGNKDGDTVCSEVYITAVDANSLTVRGTTDGENYFQIPLVNMTTYEVELQTEDEAGIYLISAGSLKTLRVTCGAQGVVELKLLY